MLGVQSYPELFTTLFGWHQYQNIWGVITETGLVYLPFIGMLLKNWLEPVQSQETKAACDVSLRRVFIQLVSMLLVIMVALQPVITLNPKKVSFKRQCEKGSVVTVDNNQTTFNMIMPISDTVKVPLLWYMVISVSQGITQAATQGLPCSQTREIQVKLDTTQIKDEHLRKDIAAFAEQCYVPAWTKYLKEKPNLGRISKDDVQWLGSTYFLNATGYYDSHFSYQPVKGFETPQTEEEVRPSCKEWWSHSEAGLHNRLMSEIEPNVLRYLMSNTHQIKAKEIAIKKLLYTSAKYSQESLSGPIEGWGSTANFLSNISASLGLFFKQTTFYPKIYVLISALPLIQSILLCTIYLFLPIMITFSGFKISVIKGAAFAIFSVIFWGFLWALAGTFDDWLIKAMYPITTGEDSGSFADKIILDMVALGMYIGLPIIATTLMASLFRGVGLGFAGVITQVSQPATQAAGELGGLKQIATMATKISPLR